jgi:hypothetical protein
MYQDGNLINELQGHQKEQGFSLDKIKNTLGQSFSTLKQLGKQINEERMILGLYPESIIQYKDNLIFRTALNIVGQVLFKETLHLSLNVRKSQLQLLKQILQDQKKTAFGQDHQFDTIKTLEDFRKKIPLRSYDELKPYIDRHLAGEENVLTHDPIIQYATTSGTTGEMKFIPITERLIKESHQGPSRLLVYTILKEYPKAYTGKIFALVSPADEGQTENGDIYGSTSGMLIQNLGGSFAKKYIVPYKLLSIQDYASKYFVYLYLSMIDNVTFLSTANPSTILLLAKKANEYKDELFEAIEYGKMPSWLKLSKQQRKILHSKTKKRPDLAKRLRHLSKKHPEGKLMPNHYWPELALICCWRGGNCSSVLSKLHHWYGDTPIKELGYLASEIRGSINISDKIPGGVLTAQEHFFEFVSVDEIDDNNPRFLLADELELGKEYYIYFTNKAGLYRYHINDIVRVSGFLNQLPSIEFVQKGRGVTNITGEKLYEQQLVQAVEQAELIHQCKTTFFIAYANVEKAQYELLVEFDQRIKTKEQIYFLQTVESQLQKLNIEYRSKRQSLRLKPLRMLVLGSNSYEKLKTYRVARGQREGQFKLVLLDQDPSVFEALTIIQTLDIEGQ